MELITAHSHCEKVVKRTKGGLLALRVKSEWRARGRPQPPPRFPWSINAHWSADLSPKPLPQSVTPWSPTVVSYSLSTVFLHISPCLMCTFLNELVRFMRSWTLPGLVTAGIWQKQDLNLLLIVLVPRPSVFCLVCTLHIRGDFLQLFPLLASHCFHFKKQWGRDGEWWPS